MHVQMLYIFLLLRNSDFFWRDTWYVIVATMFHWKESIFEIQYMNDGGEEKERESEKKRNNMKNGKNMGTSCYENASSLSFNTNL